MKGRFDERKKAGIRNDRLYARAHRDMLAVGAVSPLRFVEINPGVPQYEALDHNGTRVWWRDGRALIENADGEAVSVDPTGRYTDSTHTWRGIRTTKKKMHHFASDYPRRVIVRTRFGGYALCDLCGAPLMIWMTDDAEWKRLPPEMRKLVLCVDCFRKNVQR